MTSWQVGCKEWSKLTGWELVRQPLDNYVNWYFDCISWTLLNTWFIPFRMPEIHSDTDKWVSQFTLNGLKSTNICRPI
jgi:hypothetical protein